jgi:hypothetical protein
MTLAALQLTGDVPDEIQLQRWLGEPVKVLVLSTRLAAVESHTQYLTSEACF